MFINATPCRMMVSVLTCEFSNLIKSEGNMKRHIIMHAEKWEKYLFSVKE
jgi:hypothetical protein